MARVEVANRTIVYPEMQDTGGNKEAGPPVSRDLTAWHTFGVEWRQDFFTFSVDGQVTFDSRRSPETMLVPRTPMFLYIQMVSGPDGPVPGPGPGTPSTVTTHVDWVRFHP